MQETHVCKLCGLEKPISKFHTENGKIRRNACMSCLGKRDRAKLKLDAIKHFGGKCMCCGETHPYFLSLDHVRNDGNKHRETGLNEQQIYREARREGFPADKYQLLCMNCNFAKGHHEDCPHRLGISCSDALERLEHLSRGYEHDYSIVTDKQREALKLGPQSQAKGEEWSKNFLEKFLKGKGIDLNEALRKLS